MELILTHNKKLLEGYGRGFKFKIRKKSMKNHYDYSSPSYSEVVKYKSVEVERRNSDIYLKTHNVDYQTGIFIEQEGGYYGELKEKIIFPVEKTKEV